MLSNVSRYKFGIVLSALIAFIFVFPQLAAPFMVPSFQGISPMEADSEAHYFSRIMSARYHGAIGNPFLADENEDFLPSLISIESVFGRVAAILPFSVHFWNVTLRLIASFLLAFFLYRLLLAMFDDDAFASVAMGAVLIGTTFVLASRELFSLFTDPQYSMGFLHFSRFINPVASGVLFFGFCYLLYRAVINQDVSRNRMLVLGTVLGSLLYAYIFFWVFASVLIACTCAFMYIRKDRSYRNWFLCIVLSILMDLPYLGTLLYRYADLSHVETARHLGLFATREPLVDTLLVTYTVLLLILTVMNRSDSRTSAGMRSVWLFNVLFFITSWIVVNQQIITGYSLQPGHFQWYMLAPGLLLAAVSILHSLWLRIHTIFRSAAAILLMLFFLGSGLLIQYRASAATRAVLGERQYAAGALRWLREEGRNGSVVFANRENANLVPIYTDDKLFYANSVVIYPVDQERIYLGHFMWWRSENLTVEELTKLIDTDPGSIQAIYESHNYQRLRRLEPERLAKDISRLLTGYADFLKQDAGVFLDRYHVRYILEEKNKDDFVALLGGGERTVYEDGSFRILERTTKEQP